ncbi:DUF4097 family beta strand repeat-containing protein [Psychromicrobium lacuslunae]|uniref:DUF4097 domain-containing protein n=1 Tax=Psychromicrobium lacuslunae TaxID=1618207 RepID=A0A0D4BZ06_9MICC|nr:DUF4097 family beta strand repeat-containing protein [Psychromicrobium lacuslunae]AJT41380.1 hypothetical protein UM93_07365 [Psychromicrobium lacuslunae]
METWTIDSPQTIELDGIRNLRLLAIKGRFDVIAHQDPTETVTRLSIAEVTGDPLEVVKADERLEIRHGKTDAASWLSKDNPLSSQNHLVITVEVPKNTSVDAKTVGGEGLLSGLDSLLKISSVNGSLVCDATVGELHVNTVSGEAIVQNHYGTFSSNSVSGEVTASGELQTIKSTTVTGDLSFDVFGPISSITTNSVSGNVLIRLPEKLSTKVKVNSVSGSVNVNDETIKVIGNTSRQFGDASHGIVNISVNSVSGSVTVFNRLAQQEVRN